jgi:zinc protease
VTGIAHPIYTHTGGHERDHAYWNRASMLRLYDDYIVPNNATLTLIGDMTVDEARSLGARYFGQVPRAPAPPANMDVEAEPPPGGSVRLDWLEPIEPTILIRYRIPGVGHPDRPAFDVVARLLRGPDGALASSPASRGGDWQASASSAGSQNTLTLQARAGRDEDLAGLERGALEAIERFRRDLVDEPRLARVRREFLLDWELLRADRGGLATQFGSFAIADDWRTLRTQYEARRTTTAEDVRRVAQRYLVPWNRVIATTRRSPQPRAEANTASARPVITQKAGESR